MIEVELPDGRIAEFPETMQPAEIQKILAEQFPSEQVNQSYAQEIMQGSPMRQQEALRIEDQYQQGNLTIPEVFVQKTGEIAGRVGDITGRAIGDVVGGAYGLLPEDFRESVSERLQPIGSAIAPALQTTGELYGQVKEKFPRAVENIEGAANIALFGAPALNRSKQIMGGVERGGKAIGQKFLPNPKELDAESLKATASELFNLADEKGGVLKPEITNKFIQDISEEIPQTQLGKIVAGGDSPVSSLIDRVQNIQNQPMSLKAAQEIDEILGDLAYSNVNPATGAVNKEGMKFLNIQSKFRNVIEEASEASVVGGKDGFKALKDARKYWSTSLRLRDVEKAIQRGLMTEQPQTGIKNAFKSLYNSKKISQYSPAEVQAIKNAAEKGILVDVLGTMGSRLNPQLVGAGTFIGTGNPLASMGAAIAQTAVSGASRKAATALQLKKAKQVEKLIRQRVGQGSNQKMALTPEIKLLAKELGIVSIPSGGVSALLDEINKIQETKTIIGD